MPTTYYLIGALYLLVRPVCYILPNVHVDDLATSINQLCLVYALYLLVRTVLGVQSVLSWHFNNSLSVLLMTSLYNV